LEWPELVLQTEYDDNAGGVGHQAPVGRLVKCLYSRTPSPPLPDLSTSLIPLPSVTLDPCLANSLPAREAYPVNLSSPQIAPFQPMPFPQNEEDN
jgi:hypothetical protein